VGGDAVVGAAVPQFLSFIVIPGMALGGLFAALQGWSRLSARRTWADVTAEEWRAAKRRLGLFLSAYPVLWFLTQYIMRLPVNQQRVALGACSLVLLVWGARLNRRFRERSVVGEVR
jgi:hypothetical protein